MDFYRFPHTPHLAWLGKDQPRDDKVLPPGEARDLLARDLIVEEKVDGANVGFSVDENGDLCVQNRGSILRPDNCHPQFKPLFRWLQPRMDALVNELYPDRMLFGEWCYAVHSLRYSGLSDWFLAFDVFDRGHGRFWSARRRDELTARLNLATVPRLGAGHFDLPGLQALLGQSRLGTIPAEGLYIRADDQDWLDIRAKLVRAEFTQAIDVHWSQKSMQANSLAGPAFQGWSP